MPRETKTLIKHPLYLAALFPPPPGQIDPLAHALFQGFLAKKVEENVSNPGVSTEQIYHITANSKMEVVHDNQSYEVELADFECRLLVAPNDNQKQDRKHYTWDIFRPANAVAQAVSQDEGGSFKDPEIPEGTVHHYVSDSQTTLQAKAPESSRPKRQEDRKTPRIWLKDKNPTVNWCFLDNNVKTTKQMGRENLDKTTIVSLKTQQTYLVTRQAKGINLQKYLASQRNNPSFTVEKKLEIAEKLLMALAEYHQNGLVHRDIKPANIMIDEQADGKIAIEIIDNDMVCENGVFCNVAGTFDYAAPEIVSYFAGLSGNRTAALYDHDIWSTGIVLFEIFYPNGADTRNNALKPILEQYNALVLGTNTTSQVTALISSYINESKKFDFSQDNLQNLPIQNIIAMMTADNRQQDLLKLIINIENIRKNNVELPENFLEKSYQRIRQNYFKQIESKKFCGKNQEVAKNYCKTTKEQFNQSLLSLCNLAMQCNKGAEIRKIIIRTQLNGYDKFFDEKINSYMNFVKQKTLEENIKSFFSGKGWHGDRGINRAKALRANMKAEIKKKYRQLLAEEDLINGIHNLILEMDNWFAEQLKKMYIEAVRTGSAYHKKQSLSYCLVEAYYDFEWDSHKDKPETTLFSEIYSRNGSMPVTISMEKREKLLPFMPAPELRGM